MSYPLRQLVHPHHGDQGPADRQQPEDPWQPEHIRDGRFGDWLENVIDWSLSPRPLLGHAAAGLGVRQRAVRAHECLGSYAELKESCPDRFAGVTRPIRPRAVQPAPALHRRLQLDLPRVRGHDACASATSSTAGSTPARCRSRRCTTRSRTRELIDGEPGNASSRRTSSARRSTRRAAGSTRCTSISTLVKDSPAYKTLPGAGAHPRRRGPQDEQAPRQRGRSLERDRQLRRRRLPLVLLLHRQPVHQHALHRGKRGGKPAALHHSGLEHLQLLHDLRQHRRLRPGGTAPALGAADRAGQGGADQAQQPDARRDGAPGQAGAERGRQVLRGGGGVLLQLVRAPQPPPLLAAAARRRQAGRLSDAVHAS